VRGEIGDIAEPGLKGTVWIGTREELPEIYLEDAKIIKGRTLPEDMAKDKMSPKDWFCNAKVE